MAMPSLCNCVIHLVLVELIVWLLGVGIMYHEYNTFIQLYKLLPFYFLQGELKLARYFWLPNQSGGPVFGGRNQIFVRLTYENIIT